jgi:serine/threonine-protein kinase
VSRALEFVPRGYEVIDEIGRGGMGIVLRAKKIESGQFVALKILPYDASVPDVMTDRFAVESSLGHVLTHPDIVQIFEYGKTDRFMWMAMELLEGDDLSTAMYETELGLSDRIGIIVRAANALHFAHERGIIHRDIKPSNVFLTRKGEVKLLDFGVAKVGATKLTATGNLVGTPHYMAPEQIMSQIASPRSDVFALGVLCFELLTGELPWNGANAAAVLMSICVTAPQQFRELASMLQLAPQRSEALHRVIHRAIDAEPTRRFESTKAFAEALERALVDAPVGDVQKTQEIAGSWSERRIEWALARAARISAEKKRNEPTPRIEVPATSERREGSRLLLVLAIVFIAAIGVVSWLLFLE